MRTSGHTQSEAAQSYVNEDRRCIGCGYNLKGLKSSGKCPECGRPIVKRRRGVRGNDSLVHAPTGWLLKFKAGAMLLMSAAAIAVVLPFAVPVLRRAAFEYAIFGAMMLATLGWWVGTWLTTRARPVMPTTTIDPREEWFWLRVLSRVSQAGWPLAVGVGMVIARMNAAFATGAAATGAPMSLLIAESILCAVAAAGIVPLCVYLSNVSHWASDWALMMNFRACSMSVSATAFLGTLAVLGIFMPLPPGVNALVNGPVLTFGGLFLLLAVGHLLWCLWRLRGMASWAVINHVTAQMHAEKTKEQAARMAAAHKAQARRK